MPSASPLVTQTLRSFLKLRLYLARASFAIGNSLGKKHAESINSAACFPRAPVDSSTNGTTVTGDVRVACRADS